MHVRKTICECMSGFPFGILVIKPLSHMKVVLSFGTLNIVPCWGPRTLNSQTSQPQAHNP